MDGELLVPAPAAERDEYPDARLVGIVGELAAGDGPALLDSALAIGGEEGMAEVRVEAEVDVTRLAEEVAHEDLVGVLPAWCGRSRSDRRKQSGHQYHCGERPSRHRMIHRGTFR